MGKPAARRRAAAAGPAPWNKRAAWAVASTGLALACTGGAQTLGPVGKVNVSSPSVWALVVGGTAVLIAAAGLDAASTRLPPGSIKAYATVLATLLIVTICGLHEVYRPVHLSKQEQFDKGWIVADQRTKGLLQIKFNCCGYRDRMDNAVLPTCPATVKHGCMTALLADLETRIHLLRLMFSLLTGTVSLSLLLALHRGFAKPPVNLAKKVASTSDDEATAAKRSLLTQRLSMGLGGTAPPARAHNVFQSDSEDDSDDEEKEIDDDRDAFPAREPSRISLRV